MDIWVPERSAPGRGSFPTTWWGIRRWLRDFAEARPRDRLQHLDNGLKELHGLEVPPRRRLRVLATLLPTARSLLDDMHRRVNGQSLPLPEKSLVTLQTGLRLLERLARCFDAVVADETGQERPDGKRIATAAQASLALRGELLLRCAQVYMAPPEAYWRSIHAVYATAEAAGVAERRIRPVSRARTPTAPADEYARILLFSVARTEGLRRGQIWPLFRALADWCREVTVGTHAPADADMTDVVVARPDQPGPPAFRQAATVAGSANVRVLSVTPIVRALEALAERAPAHESAVTDPDALRPQTIRQLLETFRQTAVRASERQAVDQAVDVEIGLRAVHNRLAFVLDDQHQARAGNETPYRYDRTASMLVLQTIEPEGHDADADYLTHPGHDQMTEAANAWDHVHRGRPVATDTGPEIAAGERARGSWTLEDSSRGGFRLNWESDRPSRATVGDLVALRDEGNGGERAWHLGVIRWLQFLDERRFQLGAERLPGRPKPANVRREPDNPNRRRNRALEHAEPALFLPGNRHKGKPATVLLPAHMFQSGETVEVDVGQRMFRVRLTEAREQTNTFARFDIAAAPRQRMRRRDEPAADEPIWDDQ